jgi:hypothetical protein
MVWWFSTAIGTMFGFPVQLLKKYTIGFQQAGVLIPVNSGRESAAKPTGYSGLIQTPQD